MEMNGIFQMPGSTHSGLADPSKYGLTYSQVVQLIETNKWKNFYNNWLQKKRREESRDGERPWACQINKNNGVKKPKIKVVETFRCSNCKKEHPLTSKHVLIKQHIYICEKCVELVKEI